MFSTLHLDGDLSSHSNHDGDQSSSTAAPDASIPMSPTSTSRPLSEAALGPPVDYSYQSLTSCADLPSHEPNPSGVTSIHLSGATRLPCGLRLSYNSLSSVSGLSSVLPQLLSTPAHSVSYLDLSYNEFTEIPMEIVSLFPNLTVLHLANNKITDLFEIRKLSLLPNLCKVYLQNNPFYDPKLNGGLRNIRSLVIHALRGVPLRSLDSSAITDTERDRSYRLASMNRGKKKGYNVGFYEYQPGKGRKSKSNANHNGENEEKSSSANGSGSSFSSSMMLNRKSSLK